MKSQPISTTITRKRGPKPKPIADRFWAKVDRRGPNECWPWKAGTTKDGYGRISDRPRGPKLAHRIAAELAGLEVSPHLDVCHKCDNPPCCNPAHLFVGTALDNIRDAVNKGRMKTGEARRDSKLNKTAVQFIRKNAGRVTMVKMANKFGVTAGAVLKVIRFETWKNVI